MGVHHHLIWVSAFRARCLIVLLRQHARGSQTMRGIHRRCSAAILRRRNPDPAKIQGRAPVPDVAPTR